MREDAFFSPSEVTTENLKLVGDRLLSSFEAGLCELAELADALAEQSLPMLRDMSPYELFSLLGDSEREPHLPFSSLPENKERLLAFSVGISSSFRAAFAELYLERLTERGCLIKEGDFFFSALPEQTFAYVRNSLSDEAYDVFSADFPDARVRYLDSFKAACAAVASGEVGYCILPLEEGGERISGISSLIYSHGLKIVGVTPVFGFEGKADMKYALVSSEVIDEPISADDDRYLEIRIEAKDGGVLTELISVAEGYGIGVYRINSAAQRSYDGGKTSYSIVFSAEGRPFSVLLLYLALFVEGYTVVGLYKNLE